MSRVPYPFTAIRTDDDDSGKNVVPYASVSAKDEAGAPANVYDAETGGSPYSSFILDANGQKQIWVEPGIYQFSVAGGTYFSVFASSATTEDFTSVEKEKLGRVLYAVDSINVPFPSAATRASTYMIFDASGNPLGTSRNAVLGDMAFASESTPAHATTIVVNGIDAGAAAVRSALNVANGATQNRSDADVQSDLDQKLDKASVKPDLSSPNNTDAPSTLAVASAVADAMAGETPMGAWNAATNTPALASSVGTAGHWYEVSDPGTTNLNGETDWQLRDKAIFNGIIWTRIPADGVRSVDGRTGEVILNYDTVALAAAASLPVGAKYSTKGANAVGDGGHGDFIVSATALTAEDGYSCYELANGNFGNLLPVSGYINLLQLGAIRDGATDNAAAFTRANNLNKPILIPDGNFYSTVTLVMTGAGLGVVGCGMGRSIITAGALTGEAVRLMSQYQIAANFSIRASTGRSSEPYTSNGFGIRVETVDVPDDPNVTRQRCVKLDSLEIEGQTGAGIYMVGPVMDGGSVSNCRILNNKGHALAIDRGFLGGRTNKASLPTGVMNITDVLAFGNTGHALALGHPDDTITTQTVRVIVDNFDANISSMDAAQMYSTPALHGFWIAGSNNELKNSVTSGSGTQIGAFVKGTNTSIKNFRQVNTFATLEVGDNVASLPTRDITLDGVNVIGSAQANCVILSGATDIRDISIKIRNLSGITNLVDTTAIRGLTLNNPRSVRKSAVDTVYNNTTTPAPIDGLSYRAAANEQFNFRAGIFYTGDSTADLRVTVGSTEAVSSIEFGSLSGTKVGAGLAVDVIAAVTALNTPIVLGTDASKRYFEFSGYIVNGASDATITINAAQLSAVVADTTVHIGSNLTVERLIS